MVIVPSCAHHKGTMEHPFMTSIPFQQTLTAPSPCPDAHFLERSFHGQHLPHI